MSLISSFPFIRSQRTLPRQITSHKWSDRYVIENENVNLFTWKRPFDKRIIAYLNQVVQDQGTKIEFRCDLSELSRYIKKYRGTWGSSDQQGADLFWTDVEKIVTDFLVFSEAKRGRVYLKVIDNNACTKFHVDGYNLRLFTTYVGQGTEWLPEQATNRKGLGKSNNKIVKDASQVRQMNPFEVGILKGELPNGKSSTFGIVHRSPEIVKVGEKRIILRVDI